MTNGDVIISIIETVGKVQGRKRLQKMVYIMKSLGVPVNYTFIKYHYGPFCKEIELDVSNLAYRGILNEKSEEFITNNELRKIYEYELTTEGKKYAKGNRINFEEFNINDAMVIKLNNMALDKLVKIAYDILDNKPSPNEIKKKIENI